MIIKKDSQITDLKIPPHSIEAEQSVLGGLLIDNSTWDRISDFISQNDFYRYNHKLIFKHIIKLITSSKPADVITVCEVLSTLGKIEEAGGLEYLNQLTKITPNTSNIRRYAEIIRDRAILRKLMSVAEEIFEEAFNPNGKEVCQLLDDAEAKVFLISEERTRNSQTFLEVKPLLAKVIERIDSISKSSNSNEITGTPTGFFDLDQMISGMHGGELIVVAGRPSMGKTAFSMNIGEYVAVEYGLPVAIFSMEMPGTQIIMRMLSSIGELDQKKIKTGSLSEEDWLSLMNAVKKISESQIFIDETCCLNPIELRSRARRLSRQCGKLGLIIVDYIQLMTGSKNIENRANEISEISRSLKSLAKELDVPLIALSQLNRSLEQRTNKRPVMSDLRESGAIEQDADIIIFIYRDEVYKPESQEKGIAEIIISKQRNGPIGLLRLIFHGKYTRFSNFINKRNYSK